MRSVTLEFGTYKDLIIYLKSSTGGRFVVTGRLRLTILVFALLCLLIAESAAAATTIRFLAPPRNTTDGRNLYEVLVETFNASQDEIVVEYEPAASDWREKVPLAFISGTAPDVIAGWESFFRSWLELGQALPLDRYLTPDLTRDFVPSHLELYRIDGVQYALPHYTGVSGMFYNKNMFDEAGLPEPDETWSWDTITEAARKLTKRTGDLVTQWGYDVHPDWDRLVQWVWENGGRVIDEGKFVGDRLYFDEEPAIQAFEFLHSLIWEAGVAAPYSVLGKWPHEMFWSGTDLAIWFTGSWDVSVTLDRCPCDWNVAPRPMGPTGIRSAVHTSDGYMVYKGTNHPDAAVKFLLFLVSPEAQRLQMQLANLQPARLSLGAEYATETEGAARGINMKVFIDQTAYARPAPLFVNQQEVMELRWPYVDRMLYQNELPVRQGMLEWTRLANALMAGE